jgi:hypothetical protein
VDVRAHARVLLQVLGSLMAHTGSKDSCEVDAALGVLEALTATLGAAAQLAHFLPFLKSVLDFIDTLSTSQVPPPALLLRGHVLRRESVGYTVWVA